MTDLNFEKKSQFIDHWNKNQFFDSKANFSLSFKSHGLNFSFKISDENLVGLATEGLLKDLQETPNSFFQKTETRQTIRWYSAQELGWSWNEGGDHLCKFDFFQEKKLVYQRDFVAFHLSPSEIVLISDNSHDDGFFNFLRYVIPTLLLKEKKYVFHSSGVLSDDGKVNLFLGHSGYGKTTICQKFPHQLITGDDMHLVYEDQGIYWVEPTHLGQTITSWEHVSQRFPLENVFWLEKSSPELSSIGVSIDSLCLDEQRLKIIGSLSGLSWENLSESEFIEILSFARTFIKCHPIRILRSSLESEVKGYVFNEL